MKISALICDIDGTIADCTHRRASLPDWGAFFSTMADDSPIVPVIDLIKSLIMLSKFKNMPVVLFVSGRPNEYREVTINWLRKHLAPLGEDLYLNEPSRLFMRATGDHRPDHVIKKEILDKIRETYEPSLAFDDRKNVVDMWRANGLACLQMPDMTLRTEYPKDFKPVQGECILTLMVGPSGGGKSTYVRNNFHPASVLESDQFRAEICGNFKDQTQNARVFAALHDVARVRLGHGLPVVIDATHLKRKDRLAAVALAPDGSRVRYVVVNRPLSDKYRDGSWRNELGFDLIAKQEQQFKSQYSDILEGDFLENVFVVPEIQHT